MDEQEGKKGRNKKNGEEINMQNFKKGYVVG